MYKLMTDILTVANKEEGTPDLEHFKKVINEFSQSREVKNTKTRVDLILLVAGLLDWSEEEFQDVLNRFASIQFKDKTGMDIEQFISSTKKQNSKDVH
ncbi:hypothetical protein WKH56_32840 [Priestia sp. SB1]|uniref:hypothetical protein n=1 Tax=Priestia sp. SB1 TaxID=3132359 RepID=UPI003180589D